MNTQQTLELLKEARTQSNEELAKGFTQSGTATGGLTAYDLEGPAKTVYPVLAPLRNRIPRVSGRGGIQANWKAITGINTAMVNAGVSQGNRGGIINTATTDYLAAYRGIGLEDFVNFEAQYAGEGYEDVKARAVEGLLRSLMIGEENIILAGNTSMALGITATPSLVASGSGGSLATGTLSVIAVALGYEAYWNLNGFNNGNTGGKQNIAAATMASAVTRTNADGTTDTINGGFAQKSAAASVSVTGPTGSVAATVTAKAGAYGYAWFWGAAGSEVLGAVTNINSVVIAANAAGTQAASALASSDSSTNPLVYDGLLTQILKSGSGAYVKAMATGTAGVGTPLTSDSAGGIAEFESAFQDYWNLYRLGPSDIYMNATDLLNVNKKIIANGGAPLLRMNIDASGQTISAGVVVGSYLNKITNQLLKITVHPNLPQGVVLFYSEAAPYNLSGIQNILQIRTRQEYYQMEWPVRTRKWEYGVYADEVLQNYFPPAFGVIYNVANG